MLINLSLSTTPLKLNVDPVMNKQQEPSKSELKRQAKKAQDLGCTLVKCPISILIHFHLPDELLDAIKLAKSIKQNRGLKRQLQFIGKLMRHYETEKIQEKVDHYQLTQQHRNKIFHNYETWRDRFLNNESTVFNDFITQYPKTDRQHLSQLQRNALKEKQQQKSPKFARLLFKYLKETIDHKNN